MFSLNDLNPEQREAAKTINGPVLILAGAGSGKTRTLTYRITHMVKDLGIDPNSILGISFTNKAAKELKERVSGLLGQNLIKGITLSTFHSLGVQILKRDIDKLGYSNRFSIFDTSDQLGLIRQIMKQFKDEKKFDQKRIQSKISFLKNKAIDENQYTNSSYLDYDNPYDIAAEFVYRNYQEKLRFMNAIDFDDILFLTVKLFNKHPEVAEKYSRIFKYIMIDEYQDTNPLQFELVTSLTKCHNNICVVGDDDQSIYAFRGADISNILDFEKVYPGCKTVKLEQNYRSTKPILELANKVIKENKKRKDKTLRTEIPSDILPLLWAMGDSDHEAQVIVEDIEKHRRQGKSLSDLAILYRSNTQAPSIEEELRLAALPYKMLGGQKYFEKKEIKDLMAYLSVVSNPRNELALRRILNVPNRGIGMATLQKYIDKAKDQNQTLFKAMEIYPALDPNKEGKIKHFIEIIRNAQRDTNSIGISKTIENLLSNTNYYEFMDRQYEENPKQKELRKNDLNFMIGSAARFEKNCQEKNILKAFLEKMMLQDNQDDKEEDKEPQDEVTLMTLHSSKGLEFNKVYLLGMEEELLPHKRTITEGEDISEERRLAYVGITRARNELVMTYCKERTIYGRKIPRHRSRFINQLENDGLFIEQDRTAFGHLSKDEADKYKKDFFSGLMDSLE